MDRQVAITGIGAVTPVGLTARETWQGVCAGENGAGAITRFDPEETALRTDIACEVSEVVSVPEDIDDRALSRGARYGMAAMHEAIDDAGYDVTSPDWDPTRVGTSIACALGGLPEIEAAARDGCRPSPKFLLTYLPNMVGGHVSIALDARGPARTQAAACAAGTHSLADAAMDIKQGRADVMLAGGTDAAISPLGVGSFEVMRALSGRTDDPTAASRPFDADRDGFVLGEGSGMLVLESESRARARGADIYALLTGSGLTADAHHQTQPADGGSGIRRAIERALSDADVEPDDLDHVNAHGTSTPVGDAAEATALDECFGIPPLTTASKSQLGHTLGAAGAIDAVIAAKTIQTGRVPPTNNYETPDPDCDIPVATETTDIGAERMVSTSAGFGGTNGALVFESP
jgi:3-oxoacyl-[acyl-carrier-protein] synthase II